jgi:uncharacterized membrane protein
MKPSAPPNESTTALTVGAGSGRASAIVVAIFLGICAVTLLNQFTPLWPSQARLHAALLVTAFIASIAALTPTLAWLNILMAGGLAAAIGGMAHAISSVTGVPFGRWEFSAAAGPRLLGLIPWWLPVAWAVTALSSRGTARLILRKSRAHPQHGYQVILLATGLAMLTTFALQNFALHAGCYWNPGVDGSPLHLLGHGLHLFIQVAITPLLIDKFPGHRPPNFRPLFVLAGMNTVLLAALFAP